MEALLSAIANLFTINSLIGLAVGVCGGMVIGALPGLSATMGIALLIPVTYGMDPSAALIMLASIYTSAIYGGSISAILIHTPGTPSSAATCLDGYPMTQKGEALHAIGLSTVSSCIGGFISAIALLVIAPLLARISLAFSSSEYFLIALFGLTLIASLAGKSVLKGLIAGAIGLVAGLIGMSPDAYARFTFKMPALLGGVSLIPAMIGLFSISQVMTQAEERGLGHTTVKEEAVLAGRFMPPWKEFIGLVPLILKCSVVGVLVGILPGAGGDIASWVGLNMAKSGSKTPELFGTGHPEGIAAPEAANNAVTGGALIPLLTLGIPGSSTAAVLLGGLTIHGMQPGYQLFDKYADITYAVILGFMAANILMGLVGWAVGRHVVKVSKVPLPLLIPCITVFSILGSYAASQNMTDVYIAVIFGFIGYLMRKYGIPPAPVVLGLILGPMADSHFYQATRMAGGPLVPYMLSRPISIVIMLMILAALFAPFISKIVAKRYQAKFGEVGEAAEDI
ncbi:MAG: tripartite tricarboxylate transporter permease [Oscillospiraceae bacterium]|nr:tripartite tricarboxylate transporter permease [Oscillospiraceae bacterium]